MDIADSSLWEAWKVQNDANAFAEILHRHSGMVYSVCKRVLSNAGDAEDATQECFVQLMGAEVTASPSLAPWLHTVATRRAVDMARTRGRRNARDIEYAKGRPTETSAVDQEILDLVDEIVAGLEQKDRTVIVERFFRGRTLADIGEELVVVESSVRYRVDKGVEAIRKQLKRRGVTTIASSLAAVLGTQLAEAAPATLVENLGKLTTHGQHLFFESEDRFIRDARKVPIRIGGYSISVRWGTDGHRHTHVRNDKPKMKQVEDYFLYYAAKSATPDLLDKFYQLPFEPYAPVRRQYSTLLKKINKQRNERGVTRLPYAILPSRRRIYRPFGS